MAAESRLQQAVSAAGAFRCLECGRCTAVCPVSAHDRTFSPRRTVGRAIMRHEDALLADDRLWACLTCLRCTQVCPAAVSYTDLTLAVRAEAHRQGRAAVCTHGEVIHAWMRMMMQPDLEQNRLTFLDWPAPDAAGASPHEPDKPADEKTDVPAARPRTSETCETLFFVGCSPLFGAQFEHLGIDGAGVARSTVQAMNTLGVEPQVLPDERCCGHDLLWEGDIEGFEALASLNADRIRASGAKRIVTSCPECARTLEVDYPAHGYDLGAQVMHLTELADEVLGRDEDPEGNMDGQKYGPEAPRYDAVPDDVDMAGDSLAPAQEPRTKVTYHDPCRLGRHRSVYDQPRRLLEHLGFELVEMPSSGRQALCCGTNGWTHCGAANRAVQGERLHQAQDTGAEVLVTTCLKCQIHFQCARQDHDLGEEITIPMRDLAQLLAEGLNKTNGQA